MKLPVTPLLFVFTAACAPSAGSEPSDGGADADGVRVDPVGDGGSRTTFTRPALAQITRVPGAGFVGDDFVVPRADEIRQGCLIATPWISVPHAASVTAYPHLEVEWWGELQPPDTDEMALNFKMGIRHADGTISWVASEVDTSLMALERGSALRDGWYAYHGVFDNPARGGAERPFGRAQVADGDAVRLFACNAYAGVELTIHDIALETAPVP
jgi:hypothetical protein